MTSTSHFFAHYLRPHKLTVVWLASIILATIALSIATPVLAGRFIDQTLDGAALQQLTRLALLALLFAVAAQVLSVIETRAAEQLAWSATNALRIDLSTHVLQLDHAFHTSHAPGELIERVDGDVGQLARFFSRFAINIVGNGLLIAAILGVMLSVDWRLALGVAVIAGASFVIMFSIRGRATPAWASERAASADLYGTLSEHLDSLEDIQAGGQMARAYVVRGFLTRMRAWLAISTRAGMWGYTLMATTVGFFTLALAFALGMGGYLYRTDALTLGSLFLVVRLTDMLREPVRELRNEMQDFQQAAASIARVRSLLALEPAIVDGDGGTLPEGPLDIEWANVSFAYAENTPVLHNVSITVPAGRVLGLIGRTGSGKSTLTRLIPRLIDPGEGAVRIGEIDIRTLKLADLRARIGVVSQTTHLFDATIRDNLTLFGSVAVPDFVLIRTLNAIGLSAWFGSQPAGLETVIGASGIDLSAGEAQLIACARILLRNPDIIILDEASSRLDPATERLLHNAFGELLRGRTGIIIAHRLDTLEFVDDIAVISDGALIEHGDRQQLMEDGASRYAELLSVEAGEDDR